MCAAALPKEADLCIAFKQRIENDIKRERAKYATVRGRVRFSDKNTPKTTAKKCRTTAATAAPTTTTELNLNANAYAI